MPAQARAHGMDIWSRDYGNPIAAGLTNPFFPLAGIVDDGLQERIERGARRVVDGGEAFTDRRTGLELSTGLRRCRSDERPHDRSAIFDPPRGILEDLLEVGAVERLLQVEM